MGLQVPWVVFAVHLKWGVLEGPVEMGLHGDNIS